MPFEVVYTYLHDDLWGQDEADVPVSNLDIPVQQDLGGAVMRGSTLLFAACTCLCRVQNVCIACRVASVRIELLAIYYSEKSL